MTTDTETRTNGDAKPKTAKSATPKTAVYVAMSGWGTRIFVLATEGKVRKGEHVIAKSSKGEREMVVAELVGSFREHTLFTATKVA